MTGGLHLRVLDARGPQYDRRSSQRRVSPGSNSSRGCATKTGSVACRPPRDGKWSPSWSYNYQTFCHLLMRNTVLIKGNTFA